MILRISFLIDNFTNGPTIIKAILLYSGTRKKVRIPHDSEMKTNSSFVNIHDIAKKLGKHMCLAISYISR